MIIGGCSGVTGVERILRGTCVFTGALGTTGTTGGTYFSLCTGIITRFHSHQFFTVITIAPLIYVAFAKLSSENFSFSDPSGFQIGTSIVPLCLVPSISFVTSDPVAIYALSKSHVSIIFPQSSNT